MRLAIAGWLLSVFMSAQALAQTPSPAPSASAATASSPAQPQPRPEPETLTATLSSGPSRISGWFVAPTFGTTSFGGHLAYSPGIRGGIYLNQKFAVGLTAQAVGTEDTSFGDDKVRNIGTYGGLLLQYVLHSEQLIHVSVESTLGSGRWCTVIADENDGCSGKNFLVFEPVANVELNIARHVRLATGVGYRFAVAGDGQGPSSGQMSSLVARTSVVFGSF